MAIIIKARQLAADSWRLLEADADRIPAGIAPADDVIVPLALWRARREELLERSGRLGLWVGGDADPEAFAHDLRHFLVVSIHFPKFTDGRGYSLARLLRTRHAYRGELRATGDVFRDHLHFLESCGFDAYALRAGEDPRAALSAFEPFRESYQSTAVRPLPLFRRRYPVAAAGAKRS